MTTYSSIAQLPLPENTDALVAQTTFGDYANALDTMLVPQYSTTAARDAAMASGKVEGQVCAVAGELQYWDGQAWWYQGARNVILKGVDTTRISTITPTADPNLVFGVKAGGTYYASAWLVPVCNTSTVNFRFRWGSTGSAITWNRASQFGPAPNNTSVVGTVNLTGGTANLDFTVGAPNNSQNLVRSQVVFTATADDTVGIYWAQGTNTASNLVLLARSHVEYRRIG